MHSSLEDQAGQQGWQERRPGAEVPGKSSPSRGHWRGLQRASSTLPGGPGPIMIFFWPLIYKRDYLALLLGLEFGEHFNLPGRAHQEGTIFGNSPFTYTVLQGLEFPPPSPSDLAPKRQQSPL